MLSVIIPCLNEARRLPGLLAALQAQTCPPDEVIVADAGSTDETLELARAAGARLAPGGRPAAGRNSGAAAASGDLLLFLDADVLPGPDFLRTFLEQFERQQLDIASCWLRPLEADADHAEHMLAEATNLYLQMMQHTNPRAPGSCILIRRTLFEALRGFDERLALSEDHDLVQRAVRQGRFGIVSQVRLPTSMRRLRKEGLARLALKYLYCELYVMAGAPPQHVPFQYTFGDYSAHEKRPLRALSQRWFRVPWTRLSQRGRQALRRLAFEVDHFELELPDELNSLLRLGERARDDLRGWGENEVQIFEQRLRTLRPADLAALNHYLQQRLALLPALPPANRFLLAQWDQLQQAPMRRALRLLVHIRFTLRRELARLPQTEEIRQELLHVEVHNLTSLATGLQGLPMLPPLPPADERSES